jgi:hypothetical protein
MQPSYNGSSESFKRLKKKPRCVCIRFFIYDCTLTDITMIHSHHIHNHIPIRITIVIYNSMHVARTKSWPNHPFYHGIVRKQTLTCTNHKSIQQIYKQVNTKKIHLLHKYAKKKLTF